MKIKSFKLGYSLKLAFNGIFKNSVMSISSVFVLLSCLVISGSFALVSANINYNINKIDGYNKIVVFAKNGTNDYELELMKSAYEDIDGVESVVFKSNDEALEEQLKEYDLKSDFLLEKYKTDNPLKDSFEITYEPNASIETINTIIHNIETTQSEFYDHHNTNMEVVEQVNNLKNAVYVIFFWLLILLLFVAVFVIINTIKLSVYARREEIALMRYIGATNIFISIPFLFEGLIIGIFSAVIAFGAQYLLYKYLMLELIGQYDIISIIPFESCFIYIIVGFLIAGVAMGFLGSIISLKRYNKENA